ncbi:hypothetical protein Ddye_004753 [Dipteronia dyeriana]|uniref:Methionyl/Valyl/Leucyl/Isoleucyl-tRNA synthetase anticodon-binding domain-containing protein n=1 Tax=Dipteronia dyeriana TaxID=168575 RepID=A0AAD9XF92_9ROSI|nr:hypothetical protein Ddye_004753 [Dipteronia dyeriana]
MDGYRLYTVVPYLLKFLDNLTNIYVRFKRKRLKGRTGEDDCRTALSTLYNVLLTSCKVMAPFTPFFTEVLYENMRKFCDGSEESIHFCNFPQEGEYVLEELNVRLLVPCNDTLKYASLCAEPDFSVLGKQLGRSIKDVASKIKEMSQEDILRELEINYCHTLSETD